MRVNRNLSVFVQYIFDELIPPRLRDSKWFMAPAMIFVLKDGAKDFMTFKDWFYTADSKQIGALYEKTSHLQEIQGETDLNQRCVDEILKTISSKNVLEVGCGRGYLANLMSENHRVTACDIVVADKLIEKYPKIDFVNGDIENLPFKDGQFDTVVCTHTIEHTKNLHKAVSELRRVAKKELIIVVPRQRPYKYTFSLHTQFFPYEWSLVNAFGWNKKTTIKKIGDWFYHQKMQQQEG
jgi:ubiquinone/menaquinone biosynthesis C-methylase UbiE